MPPKNASRIYSILRWRDGRQIEVDDHLTVEEPLEIRVNGAPVAVTMRTPGHDEELAAGFCLTEGIVSEADEIVRVAVCDDSSDDNIVDVSIEDSDAVHSAVEHSRRATYLSSSCGLCGKQTLDRIEQGTRPFAPSTPQITHAMLSELATAMRHQQTVFSRTGGLHSACLFDPGGSLIALREDIGRHNAIDKVVGHCLLQRHGEYTDRSILIVSGRSSFEVVQKAAVARIPIVAAVSAPSSLAIDLAKRLDMTLVGFLRNGRFNIYHGAERLPHHFDNALD